MNAHIHEELDSQPRGAEPVEPRDTRSLPRRLRILWTTFDVALESSPWRVTRTALYLLLGLFLNAMPALDRVLTAPQVWAVYLTGAIIGTITLLGVNRRGSGPALMLAAFFCVWAAGIPLWHRISTREWYANSGVLNILACALITVTAVALGRGTRSGVELARRFWVVLAAVYVPFGMFEALSGRHYSPYSAYAPPAFSPSGMFGNPNNFACVLAVCTGVVLLRLCERLPRWQRAALTALALGCIALIALTLSRLSLFATLLALLAAGHLAWRRVRPSRRPPRPQIRSRSRAAGLVAASVVVLALSTVNPLIRLIAPDPLETEQSDELRRALAQAGLRMWRTDPWIGIGAGRFEAILRRDTGEIGRVIPMHNTFLELITEYGVILATPLAMLVVWLVVRMLLERGTAHETDGLPAGIDALGARYYVGVYLGGFALGGVLASSALPWTMWWLMLGSAVTTAWWLGSKSRPPRPT